MRRAGADLHALEGVVSPRILDALRVASARLAELGIRHALVGGLAVPTPRSTRANSRVVVLRA